MQLHIPAFGQGGDTGTFKSQIDAAMTVKSVSVLPVVDNTDGVYSHLVEEEMRKHITKDHKYNFLELNYSGPILSPRVLMENPDEVKKILSGTNSDAVLSGRVSKTEEYILIEMALFSRANGKAIAIEEVKKEDRFESERIRELVREKVRQLFDRLPYSGIVLSRQNTRVTVNLGLADGVSEGQVVTAILIVDEKRHPKFGFLVSTEKEILGKIRLEKVEETLSFGNIISERAKGTIDKNTKIEKTDFVEYTGGGYLTDPSSDPTSPAKDKITFGKNPNHWVPLNPPTFGKVGMALGLGSYTSNADLESSGAVQAQANIFPQVSLNGELWITPSLNATAELRQGVINIDNPLSGSEPDTLNVSISQYSLLLGYYILIHGDFFGPKVNFQGGFSKYTRFVDSSNPLALTSTTYSGFLFAIDGSLPIDLQEKITLGATVKLFVNPSLSESPATSGEDSENRINTFSLYAKYKWTERIRFKGSADFEVYSSSFTGSGTRAENAENTSERIITFNGGLEYFF